MPRPTVPRPTVESPQRSLFDDDPAPAAAPVSRPAAPAAAAPVADAAFRHPRAQRDIVLGPQRVGYELRRTRRRSIGFTIGAEGLRVSAPRWVGVAEIERALVDKRDWILRKLVEQRDRARRLEAARIDWRDGAGIPYLGETLVLVLDPRVCGAVASERADALPGVPARLLHVGLPHDADPGQIRDVVQSWLQRQAREVFERRCETFAARLGVTVRRLGLSSASTRWGSASAGGTVRLNWRLIHFALPVIDYVVAHELAHLREMNHSAAFWNVVQSVVPDYRRWRGRLREQVLPSFD